MGFKLAMESVWSGVCLLMFFICVSWLLVEVQTKEGRYALLHGADSEQRRREMLNEELDGRRKVLAERRTVAEAVPTTRARPVVLV